MRDMYIDVGGLLHETSTKGLPYEAQCLAVALLAAAPGRVRLLRYDTDRVAFVIVSPEEFAARLREGSTYLPLSGNGADARFLSLDVLRGDVFFDMDTACDLLPPRHVLYRDLKAVGADIVVYVRDMLPLQEPWQCSSLRLARFQMFFGAAMRYGDCLAASTAAACTGARELSGQLGLSCPRCLVLSPEGGSGWMEAAECLLSDLGV